MNAAEAAHRLGVAEAEVVDVRAHAGWWEARHHDMASHEEAWRPVPGAPEQTPEPAPDAEGSSGAGAGQEDDPDGPGVDTDGDGVPEGSAQQILAWVGDNRDRAAQALAAEEQRDKPRTTLVAALEKVAG